MALVDSGRFHRLALAVSDAGEAGDFYSRIFGASSAASTGRPDFAGSGRPGFADDTDLDASNADDLQGSEFRLIWHGGYPAILLASSDPSSVVGRFVNRWGPCVHSLAWEIEDMWTAEHRLRERQIKIAAVNIPGRHFFVHPSDTDGVLMEWTDTFFLNDHRPDLRAAAGALTPIQQPSPTEGGGVVTGAVVAWVTAVVSDADVTASQLASIAGARVVSGNPMRPDATERAVDVAIGDVVVRLVTPRTAASPYQAVLEVGPRLWSYAVRVPDLEATLGALDGAGIPTIAQQHGIALTDREATLGIPIEWVGPVTG
jgi:catechol 2,3-dioxygenase-like lactoylglutathione lyase family enzyme